MLYDKKTKAPPDRSDRAFLFCRGGSGGNVSDLKSITSSNMSEYLMCTNAIFFNDTRDGAIKLNYPFGPTNLRICFCFEVLIVIVITVIKSDCFAMSRGVI